MLEPPSCLLGENYLEDSGLSSSALLWEDLETGQARSTWGLENWSLSQWEQMFLELRWEGMCAKGNLFKYVLHSLHNNNILSFLR